MQPSKFALCLGDIPLPSEVTQQTQCRIYTNTQTLAGALVVAGKTAVQVERQEASAAAAQEAGGGMSSEVPPQKFSTLRKQDPFTTFHKNEDLVKKYLCNLQIGELAPDQSSCETSKNEMLVKDFREMRSTVKKMGLLNPSYGFFIFMFIHALLLDIAAWMTIWYFGKSWAPFLIGMVMFTIAQAQYGWIQHDYGHFSVFQKSKWNRLVQFFIVEGLKGGSHNWWNYMHNQHHSKPNCFRKDPDLNMHPFLFSLGKKLSLELGKMKKKYMPYQYQHTYFFFAPIFFIVFMQFILIRFTIKRKKWMDLVMIVIYNARVCLMYVPLMGFKSFMAFYWVARYFESNWFLWVSQMNHIPMNIDYDNNLDWVSCQLAATCNVNQSLFNDWFTGHLNFQIEHHLFPTMPRNNYQKVAPLVKSLCAKHGIQYQCKTLRTAFADILHSLKESGQHWQDAYHFG